MGSAPRDVWGDLAATAFVESSHLFKSLDPDARRDLLRLGQVLSFAAGETISEPADDRFFLVRDGIAAVLAWGAGGGARIATVERGALFGEGRVLGGGLPFALGAVTDVAVVAFPGAVISALAARFPTVRRLLEAVRSAREKDAAGRPGPSSARPP